MSKCELNSKDLFDGVRSTLYKLLTFRRGAMTLRWPRDLRMSSLGLRWVMPCSAEGTRETLQNVLRWRFLIAVPLQKAKPLESDLNRWEKVLRPIADI